MARADRVKIRRQNMDVRYCDWWWPRWKMDPGILRRESERAWRRDITEI